MWASRLAPAELIRALRYDSGPPLFYLLEKPFVAAAERLALADTAARLLPFLAVALLFAAVRALPRGGSRRRFLWLALSSPLLLCYGAEARAYAVLSLLGFVLFLLVARNGSGPRGAAVIALTAALALWTHYLAFLLVVSLLAAAMRERNRSSVLGLAAGLALFLPWAPVLLAQPESAIAWMREPVRVSAVGFLAALGGGARVPAPFAPAPPEPLLWLACAAGIAVLFLILAAAPADPPTRIGLAAVLLTLGGALAVSFWRPLAFAGRTEMAVLPIWLWLVARAGEESRALRRAAAVCCAIGAVSCLLILAAPRSPRPSAALLARLETEARAGDLVVATANFYLPALLTRDRGRLAAELRAFPADLANHPGWFRAQAPSDADYRRLAEDLERAGASRTVFLLLDPPYWTPRLREIVRARGPMPPPTVLPDGLLAVSPAAGRNPASR